MNTDDLVVGICWKIIFGLWPISKQLHVGVMKAGSLQSAGSVLMRHTHLMRAWWLIGEHFIPICGDVQKVLCVLQLESVCHITGQNKVLWLGCSLGVLWLKSWVIGFVLSVTELEVVNISDMGPSGIQLTHWHISSEGIIHLLWDPTSFHWRWLTASSMIESLESYESLDSHVTMWSFSLAWGLTMKMSAMLWFS